MARFTGAPRVRARLPPTPPRGTARDRRPMSEDDSSQPTAERRSWLERISAALSGEPTTREDLVELLRDVQADGLIEADTLRM